MAWSRRKFVHSIAIKSYVFLSIILASSCLADDSRREWEPEGKEF